MLNKWSPKFKVWEQARISMRAANDSQKRYYDSKIRPLGLKVGDRVYKHLPRGRKGLATKLVHHWIGPYLVTSVNDVNEWITPIGGLNGLPEVVHINNLKKYSGPSAIPEDTQCSEQDGQVANQQETTTSIVPANNQENQQQRRDIVPQGADFTPVAPLRRGPRLESRYNLRQTIKVNRRPDCIYF